MKLYKPEDKLPENNTYILARVSAPWIDSDDREGAMWTVVKFIRGIDENQRNEYSESDDYTKVERAKYFHREDVFGNNKKAYCWNEFGPGYHFGQDVIEWCELPRKCEVK